MAGSSRIICVDINPDKFGMAKQLGATDCIDPRTLGDVPVQKYIAGTMTDWGVDYSFDCTGNGRSQISCRFCIEVNGKSMILNSSLHMSRYT